MTTKMVQSYYFGYNTFLGQLLSFISTFLFKNAKLSTKKQKQKNRPLFSDILSRLEKGKQAFFSFRPTYCIISVSISFKFMKKKLFPFFFFFFFHFPFYSVLLCHVDKGASSISQCQEHVAGKSESGPLGGKFLKNQRCLSTNR